MQRFTAGAGFSIIFGKYENFVFIIMNSLNSEMNILKEYTCII